MAIKYSPNAEAVAKRVIEKVRKGQLVSVAKEAMQQGYSKDYAFSGRITKQNSYKLTIKPVVEQLEHLRQKAIIALSNKDLNKETTETLVTSLDKLTKNIQLLNGGATSNIALTVQISEAIAKKNNIAQTIDIKPES